MSTISDTDLGEMDEPLEFDPFSICAQAHMNELLQPCNISNGSFNYLNRPKVVTGQPGNRSTNGITITPEFAVQPSGNYIPFLDLQETLMYFVL
ncbi:3418_t:CDS:2, partial [Funneliformis geosporum]